jgi:NitT/TauT family transport system substrate-binding protein
MLETPPVARAASSRGPQATRSGSGRLGGLLLTLLLLAGCAAGSRATASGTGADAKPAARLRLGYFANLTHAPAIVGVHNGTFQKALGSATRLEPSIFNAGPAAVTALLSGGLDAAFIGPNPALTAHLTSAGEAVRIVSGAASGGASLVVKPGITRPAQLKGAKLATPQRGNTQDVALRTWLAEHGMETTLEGGGEVSILPQENAQTLDTFRSGAIDGAWVPEPWATRLVDEGGGTVLVDERDLWPDGRFATTLLVVRTDFLAAHPDTVAALVRGGIETIDFLGANPAEGQKLVNDGLRKLTGKGLAPSIVAEAWGKLTFTWDPVAASLSTMARNAKDAGLLPAGNAGIDTIYELGPLNAQLQQAGRQEVSTS